MRKANPAPAGPPAGARAFFDDDQAPSAPASTAHGAPSTVDEGLSWEDIHQRWTVWLSRELVDAINAEVAATGQSRASLVEAALRDVPGIARHL
jgi:hypothetical protein